MRCQNCGAENQNGKFCMTCGNPLVNEDTQTVYNGVQKPPVSTLVMSMICFCVCIFLGIPALVYNIHSREAFYMGDMDKFNRANKNSKTCSIIGFIISGAITAICILIWVVMFVGVALFS